MTATLPSTPAADPAIPQRDALLDPRSFADVLDREVTVRVLGRRRWQARYQVGRSLRVLHELEVDGDRVLVAARSFPGDVDEIARQARKRAVVVGVLPPVIPLRELGAVAWVYPNDRKLEDLPHLASKLGALLDRGHIDLQLVSWAPEKSVTVRCGSAYGKAYGERTTAREHRFHDDLRKRLAVFDTVTVPGVIASNGNLLAVEAALGRPLASIVDGDADAAYRRYGRSLAALHSLSPPREAKPLERLQPAHLLAAATVIGRARPDVADAALTLAHDLVERRPERTGWSCLHGDAHPKNALDDGDRITLIDLEQVSAGDAAAEVGGVLASLLYRSVTGQLHAEKAGACRAAFLHAYAEKGPLPAMSTVSWHTSAALLAERALRSVTRLREEGLRALPELLLLAQSTLAGEAS